MFATLLKEAAGQSAVAEAASLPIASFVRPLVGRTLIISGRVSGGGRVKRAFLSGLKDISWLID